MAPSELPPVEPPPSRWRYLAALWFVIVGYFAGGMLGAGIAKLVGLFERCTPQQGLPACNIDPYFQWGTIVGMITLPALVIWRMWLSDAAYRRNSQRG